jgi:chemotaxis family two-component system sensor kinase Cph1
MGAQTKSFVDTTLCEREPIHIPGTIQPHGCLLITDHNLIITHFSQNARTWFTATAGNFIGAEILAFFDSNDANTLKDSCERAMQTNRSLRFVIHTRHRSSSIACTIHPSASRFIFEFEQFDPTLLNDYFATVTPLVNQICSEIQTLNSADQILDRCVETIRDITKFDRVLAYRFDHDWHGVVISESCEPSLPPFLGLHFPASDIPSQARRLYEINPIRLIADRFDVPTPIVPLAGPDSSDPIDLTPVSLRSVSPIHLEYLANLGVVASMSLSLIVNGKLWGLIACHHRTAHPVSPVIRDTALMIAEVASLRLQSAEIVRSSSEQLRWRTQAGAIAAECSNYSDIRDGLVATEHLLQDWISAGGHAIVDRGFCQMIGKTPERSAIDRIISWLKDNHPYEVFATNSLAKDIPEAEQWRSVASGLLAIPIRGSIGNFLLLFRPEVLQTTSWAGNPSKSVFVVGDTAHLSPRRSFAVWSQISHLHSLPWLEEEIKEAEYLGSLIQKILQARIEQIAFETELLKSRQNLSIQYLANAVEEAREISRECSFSIERIPQSEIDSLEEESRKKLSEALKITKGLPTFFSSLSYVIQSMMLPWRENIAPIDEVLAQAWNQHTTLETMRGNHFSISLTPIPSDSSVEPLKIASAAAACFIKPFEVMSNFISDENKTIFVHYGVHTPSSESKTRIEPHIIFLIRPAGGIPFSESAKLADFFNANDLSPESTYSSDLNDLGFGLAQSRALAESLGGDLRLIHDENYIPAALLSLPFVRPQTS